MDGAASLAKLVEFGSPDDPTYINGRWGNQERDFVLPRSLNEFGLNLAQAFLEKNPLGSGQGG